MTSLAFGGLLFEVEDDDEEDDDEVDEGVRAKELVTIEVKREAKGANPSKRWLEYAGLAWLIEPSRTP